MQNTFMNSLDPKEEPRDGTDPPQGARETREVI